MVTADLDYAVIDLTQDDDHSWILKAGAERAREAEDRARLQKFVDAIAERRSRDLLDLTAATERELGWPAALQHLKQAAEMDYSLPVTPSGPRARLEPLKYREMVFGLFSCTGFEPVNVDTKALLSDLEGEASMVTASLHFSERVCKLAIEQITSSESFFFDQSMVISNCKPEMQSMFETLRNIELRRMKPVICGDTINIASLWSTEIGRRALAELGVKGKQLPLSEASVLSVIQRMLGMQSDWHDESQSTETQEYANPSNCMYSLLLASIIDQDQEALRSLGSRHAVFTLNALLDNHIAGYETTESSDDYRKLVYCVNSHVVIRTQESVAILGKLAKMEDARIVTPAIVALSGFYHESAVSVLIDIVCQTRTREILDASLSALENIVKKSPEARYMIHAALRSGLPNRNKLKRVYQKMPKDPMSRYY
ncbi:MAG: hypothetical protein C4K49_04360 [Candidatus Thorarchaeota archaeon]|nr:MAG: hypothetical protein C4K49_04360 [Candidatus Thorarchaeota archaeon]